MKPMRNRPKNLNLLTIRLPINAVVSIMHRMSGVVLFLLLPIMLWQFQLSLANESGYAQVLQAVQHWSVKLVLILLAWPLCHHFYAGLRHLAQDMHWMTSLHTARLSSRIVLLLDACSVVLIALMVW